MLKCVISVLENLLIVNYYAERYGERMVKYGNTMDMETEINRFLCEFGRMNTHKIQLDRYK